MNRTMVCLLTAVSIAAVVGVAWAADAKEEKVVRHVVLFKFKDDAPADKVKAIEDAFVALKDQIDVIKDLEWGTDISPENLQQGFTHCFLLTFANVQDRDAYLPHPKHKAFGALLGPYLDKVLVVDFETK